MLFKRKNTEYYFLICLLIVIGLLLFFWSGRYTIGYLEDLRMTRAHQFLYSVKPYFLKPLAWAKDLEKNKIYVFSLGYLLPAPLMLILGDIPGFKLAHILASMITVGFLYLILRKNIKYKPRTCFYALILLLTSYGFLYLSTFATLDAICFMFFFMFIYFYLNKQFFLACLFYFCAMISKDPRIILPTLIGLFVFVFVFDRKKLKSKSNWIVMISFFLVFLLVQKFMAGQLKVDAFPFGTADNSDFFHYLKPFNWNHIYGIMMTAPILFTVSILGMLNFYKKPFIKAELIILFSFFPLFLIYLASPSGSSHYIYFVFLFFTIFSARFIDNNSSVKNTSICVISLFFLVFLLIKPIYFSRLSLKEVSNLRQELLPYSNEGFILSRGFDWGLYFHGQRFGNIWDWRWVTGTGNEIKNVPDFVITNLQLIAVPQSYSDIFFNWPQSNSFRLLKIYKNWLFFVPLQDKQ